jgi:hypothetical protein
VIVIIWPHINSAGDPIGHVEKAGDIGNIPDIAITKANIT